MRRLFCMLLVAAAITACSKEVRTMEAEQPQTPPDGADDPRWAQFRDNVYQVSQGGRYFSWYDCGACHGGGATGVLDLTDGRWTHGGRPDRVYASIAGHPGAHYGQRIPTEQLWQITAYVLSLASISPEQRRRRDLDQAGEPTGDRWSGPVR